MMIVRMCFFFSFFSEAVASISVLSVPSELPPSSQGRDKWLGPDAVIGVDEPSVASGLPPSGRKHVSWASLH